MGICALRKPHGRQDMEVRACNPSTYRAKGGGAGVTGQPGLHSKTLPPQKKK